MNISFRAPPITTSSPARGPSCPASRCRAQRVDPGGPQGGCALTYAPEPAFSLVLYINQSTDEAGNAAQRELTRKMIDLTLQHGGRFFLPYQLHYTGQQLLASYPELPAFLAKKLSYDPGELFTSTFYRALKMVGGSVG
jgi:hypothetical protein